MPACGRTRASGGMDQLWGKTQTTSGLNNFKVRRK